MKADFHYGGHLSLIQFMGGTGLINYGAGFRGGYVANEWTGGYAGVTFCLPEDF